MQYGHYLHSLICYFCCDKLICKTYTIIHNSLEDAFSERQGLSSPLHSTPLLTQMLGTQKCVSSIFRNCSQWSLDKDGLPLGT